VRRVLGTKSETGRSIIYHFDCLSLGCGKACRTIHISRTRCKISKRVKGAFARVIDESINQSIYRVTFGHDGSGEKGKLWQDGSTRCGPWVAGQSLTLPDATLRDMRKIMDWGTNNQTVKIFRITLCF
jgi:hypothetical protein